MFSPFGQQIASKTEQDGASAVPSIPPVVPTAIAFHPSVIPQGHSCYLNDLSLLKRLFSCHILYSHLLYNWLFFNLHISSYRSFVWGQQIYQSLSLSGDTFYSYSLTQPSWAVAYKYHTFQMAVPAIFEEFEILDLLNMMPIMIFNNDNNKPLCFQALLIFCKRGLITYFGFKSCSDDWGCISVL